MFRRNETTVSHQRKTSEKSLDKSVGHHPYRVARLPGSFLLLNVPFILCEDHFLMSYSIVLAVFFDSCFIIAVLLCQNLGCQSRRDPSLLAGRSAVVKGLRRVTRIGENQRDQLRRGIGRRNRFRRRFRRGRRH